MEENGVAGEEWTVPGSETSEIAPCTNPCAAPGVETWTEPWAWSVADAFSGRKTEPNRRVEATCMATPASAIPFLAPRAALFALAFEGVPWA